MIPILKRKDGYVLTWVLCIFIVIALISTVTVTSAVMSTASTLNNHNAQQAYYTAKAAVSSVAEYITKNSDNESVINEIINNPGIGSVENMGDYTVTVAYKTADKIEIKASARYNSQESTVTAYLVKRPAPSGIIPTDNVLWINGPATGLGQCRITGDVFIDGDMYLGQGSALAGFVVVQGTTTLAGSGNTTSGLFSHGDVNLQNGASVYGTVLSKGDIKVTGGSTVYENMFADGSLTMEGSGTIKGTATIFNDVTLSGGSKIQNDLYYYNNVSTAWGTVSSFVDGLAVKQNDYIPIDDSPYLAQKLPIIATPTSTQRPELYHPVVIENINAETVISESGTINSAVVAQLKGLPWGTSVKIDATKHDIHLLLNNTDLNLDTGINLEVRSDGINNVYVYLTGSSSITVNSNEYIGMEVRSTNPRIYIFGDDNQRISLNNNSELDACVYMPNGTFSASGSALETYKFVGSCTAKNVNISSNVFFYYSEPDISNTPLDVFYTGENPSARSGWLIENWGIN